MGGSKNPAEDFGEALIYIIIVAVVIIYLIVMFIIKYIVFFVIVAALIGIIWYVIKMTPIWEEEKKKKAAFISRNEKTYAQTHSLYNRVGHNIKMLEEAGLPVDELKRDLIEHNSIANIPPERLYSTKKHIPKPYKNSKSGLQILFNKTIILPKTLLRLKEVTKHLSSEGVEVNAFEEVLSKFPAKISLAVNQQTSGEIVWIPDFYKTSTTVEIKEFPNGAPDLRNHITSQILPLTLPEDRGVNHNDVIH